MKRVFLLAWLSGFCAVAPAQDVDLDFLFEDTSADAASGPAAPAETGRPPPEMIPVAAEPAPTLAPAEAPPSRQLEEVVVTAQKIEQSLQDVPVSVTAIGGDFIADTGAADLADVSLYVPNVRVDADDLGSPQVFIRGFGTNAFNPSFESSVGFVQDEIYFGRPGYFTEAMFDIDRVEVLRGPQGTLFGKNTIAGVFNVFSKGPSEDFAANLSYKGGQYGEHRIEAGAGGMLGDRFGLRVAGLYQRQDGQLYNPFLDRDEENPRQYAGRVKLRFLATDTVDIELMAVTSNTDIHFWPYQLYRLDEGTRQYLENFDPEIEDDPTDFRTSFDTEGWLNKGSDTVSLKTDWLIGDLAGIHDLETVLILGYSRFNIDQLNELDVSPADIGRLDSHERHRQQTAEWRFTGSSDGLFGLGVDLQFVSGFYYYGSTYNLDASTLMGRDFVSWLLTDDGLQLASGAGDLGLGNIGANLPPAVIATLTQGITTDNSFQFLYEQEVDALAWFGQMSWWLTDRLSITPGLRFNLERKRVSPSGQGHCQGRIEGANNCLMQVALGAEDYDFENLRRDEHDLSPKIAIQYRFDSGLNVYGSFVKGYKSGGYNAIAFQADSPESIEYEPENAQTYELGAKGRFFGNTLQLNATVYDTRFDNLQVLAFNGALSVVSNAGRAHSQGLEADFMWLTPFEPLSIMGSVGLLDAKYDEYPGAPAPISEGIGAEQDLGGKRIAFAPRQTATLTPTLSFPIGSTLLNLSVDVLYQGEQYTDTDLDPNSFSPDYTMYSARIGLSDMNDRWSLTIGGSNLSDERVLNQVTDAVFFPGTYFAQQAAGRQLFGVLSVNW